MYIHSQKQLKHSDMFRHYVAVMVYRLWTVNASCEW